MMVTPLCKCKHRESTHSTLTGKCMVSYCECSGFQEVPEPEKAMKFMIVERLPNYKDWYVIRAKKDNFLLANIRWTDQWKCFVLEPFDHTQFSAGCLRELMQFMNGLKRED